MVNVVLAALMRRRSIMQVPENSRFLAALLTKVITDHLICRKDRLLPQNTNTLQYANTTVQSGAQSPQRPWNRTPPLESHRMHPSSTRPPRRRFQCPTHTISSGFRACKGGDHTHQVCPCSGRENAASGMRRQRKAREGSGSGEASLDCGEAQVVYRYGQGVGCIRCVGNKWIL